MAFFNKKDEEFKKHALKLGSMYDNLNGREILAEELLSSGLLSSIDSTDPEAVPRHNIMARKLFEMGILADDNIEKIVDSLLNLRYKE